MAVSDIGILSVHDFNCLHILPFIPTKKLDVNGHHSTLQAIKNPLNLMIRGFNGLPRTSLDLYLVEAGGIEPPSVSTPPQGLHAYLVL